MDFRIADTFTNSLAVMNLALRGIEADFGPEHADTFRRDLHPDLCADLEKITSTYHAWCRDPKAKTNSSLNSQPSTLNYSDVAGFCKSATTAEISAHGHVLTPGRYVGAEEVEDDGDPFEEEMPRLVAELHAQFAESAKLEQAIKANLRGLGYGG